MDLIFLAVIVGFFLLTGLIVLGCVQLAGGK